MYESDLKTNLPDIQGIITSGYGHLGYGAYLFLHIDDATGGKRWLAQITPQIATAERWPTGADNQTIKPQSALFIALTAPGLQTLGLPFAALDTFPQAFTEGMTSERRSFILGDEGANAPDDWDLGGPNTPAIHALLMILADTAERRDSLAQQHLDALTEQGISLVTREDGAMLADKREHFGFVDGISQPHLTETPRYTEVSEPAIAAGEFILGYTNEYGKMPFSPTLDGHDLGRNGSYLVFRKLAQDVAGFWRFMAERSEDAKDRLRLASKMVGRWPKGAPLTLEPGTDRTMKPEEINRFLYTERDPHGERCPLGSHIRRSNPRDSLPPGPAEGLKMADRHLIIRRGLPYGDPIIDFDNLPPHDVIDDGEERGLLFFAINANIARQFEFIQQMWANSTKFHGLYNDPDPIIANTDETHDFTMPGKPLREKVHGLQRFVTVKGGAYFFLPGISALRRIAEL